MITNRPFNSYDLKNRGVPKLKKNLLKEDIVNTYLKY